jgi:hypothetical protein
MNIRKKLWPAALIAQAYFSPLAQAQILDDIEVKREGKDAVAMVRFTVPVQFQRSIASKSGDLIQIFYSILQNKDATITQVGERRVAGGNGIPQFVVTDEAVSNDDLFKRKLLVRISQPGAIKARAGRTKDSLEIVLEGMGPLVLMPARTAEQRMPEVQAVEAIPAPSAPGPEPEVEVNAGKLMAAADAANDRGDYQDAITALNTLLNLPPNSRTRKAQEQIGLTRLKAGDNQRARGEFETFLKLYPTGPDSDLVRQFLVNLPATVAVVKGRGPTEPVSTTNGSLSVFYYGGQSQTRSQDFVDSPLGGLPVLLSESNLSGTDQKQVQTNLDLSWRYRDAEKDMRFVVRDNYSADLMPNRPSKNRLSALYFDQRSLTNGTSFKVGRQSPVGGGVLYRFDGIQGSYTFAPKWKASAVYGVPTDVLLDSKRHFYGAWVDADALAPNMSGSVYLNQQMIDDQIDRSAVGAELRYFNDGVALSGQMDYDQVLQGLNIATVQGSWQFADSTVINFLVDRRATPVRSLGNILFFQDPMLPTPARNIQDLLATTPIDMLRGQVNGITSFQTQGMLGFTTPVATNWQAGANLNYTNVDEIQPIAVILPNGQPSTGDLWSLGMQLIGSNLYSSRDTHVFSATFMSGPTYKGTMLSYNNLTGIDENWQVEPSLRLYLQEDSLGNKMKRWTPGVRMTYRLMKRVSLETELSYEIADSTGPTRNESSQRMFYYIGARFDF